MKIPIYSFGIPKIGWINNKPCLIRGLQKYIVTPISISKMKWGSMEIEEGQIYQNISLKSFTLIDALKLFKNITMIIGIFVLIYGLIYGRLP